MPSSIHNPARVNPLIRVMPSLTDVAFIMPLVFLFGALGGVQQMMGDGDTGWHIRAGQWMIENGRLPERDLFSFTMPDRHWMAWEWGWDVLFASLYNLGGMPAVVLASLIVLCLTFALLYRLVLSRSGNPLVSIGLTLLAAAGSTVHWLARPHIFTLLGTVVYLAVLERARTKELVKLHIAALILLMVIWTNLHGGFAVGIVIAGAYAVGCRSWKFAALTAGCFAATFVNPFGWQLHRHIWEYLRDPRLTNQIAEFQAPNMQLSGAGFFETMLIAGIVTAGWCVMRRRWTDALLIAGWAHLSLLVVRNIPIFMIVAAPIVGAGIADWMARRPFSKLAAWLKDAGNEAMEMERPWRLHAVSAAALVLLVLAMFAPQPAQAFRAEYDSKKYPARAIEQLTWLSDARVFTDDEWGDYLIYRLYPGTKVFIDGRSDFYGAKFAEEYTRISGVQHDWERLLLQHQVNAVLLPVSAPLAGALKESNRWKVYYDDGRAIAFRPAANAAGYGMRSTSVAQEAQKSKKRSDDL
jgi:hypothetical protein